VVEQGSLPTLLARNGTFASMYGAREPRQEGDPLAIP